MHAVCMTCHKFNPEICVPITLACKHEDQNKTPVNAMQGKAGAGPSIQDSTYLTVFRSVIVLNEGSGVTASGMRL